MSLLACNQMQEEIPSQSILALFSLAAAILFLDPIRFLQLQLVGDKSSIEQSSLPSFPVHGT